MQVIEPYIKYLEEFTRQLEYTQDFKNNYKEVENALNGELSKTLRKLVPSQALQEAGAFFTGEGMADELVDFMRESELANFSVLDSACGGGNLLLAFARRLPLCNTLEATVNAWGQVLHGIDLHNEFVRATRARLTLLAALRGILQYGKEFFDCQVPALEHTFPYIQCADSVSVDTVWPKCNAYLLNPPFNKVAIPEWCKWGTGRASQAAIFITKCLKEADEGSIIRAILPDVLRSGSRYNQWRKQIEKLASIKGIKILGKFDSKTNVDVFLLTLAIGIPIIHTCPDWLFNTGSGSHTVTIGAECDVKVGRVVPHRDVEEGPLYPYLDVQNLPQWAEIFPETAHRNFLGNTFLTPFVVVRRNSRASDINRAVATLVKSRDNEQNEHVAVENHLLVLRPKSGRLEDCKELLCVLRDARTNEWLNERIRCRHLTVGSIQCIPWWTKQTT